MSKLKKAKGEWYVYPAEELKKVKSFPMYVKSFERISVRSFCFVDIENKKYLVDSITGSMYSPCTGECMSTPQLKIMFSQMTVKTGEDEWKKHTNDQA